MTWLTVNILERYFFPETDWTGSLIWFNPDHINLRLRKWFGQYLNWKIMLGGKAELEIIVCEFTVHGSRIYFYLQYLYSTLYRQWKMKQLGCEDLNNSWINYIELINMYKLQSIQIKHAQEFKFTVSKLIAKSIGTKPGSSKGPPWKRLMILLKPYR